MLLYWGWEAPGESWTLSWGLWIIHGSRGDWHEPRKGTRTEGMAGRQIGDSDGILIVLQGTQPISVIVMLKMQHNTNPFSRALKQTMITEKQSLNTRQDHPPRLTSGSVQQSVNRATRSYRNMDNSKIFPHKVIYDWKSKSVHWPDYARSWFYQQIGTCFGIRLWVAKANPWVVVGFF